MQDLNENVTNDEDPSLPTTHQPSRLLEVARQHFAITSTSELFRWKGFYLLLGFIAASLAGNVLVTKMFDETDWGLGWMQVAFMAGGLLVAQFTSLALWCVLGVGPVASRLTITLGLSCVSCFAYILGHQLMDKLEQFQAIYIFVCGAGGFAFACLAILIARFYGGYRLSTVHIPSLSHQLDSQVSLKYLIGLTTGVAILIALFRAVFPDSSNGGPPSAFVLLMLILQNAVFTLFWLWACIALFTGAKSRAHKLMILLGVCVLVTPLHLVLMRLFYPVEVGWIEILNTYAYAIGFIAYTWLALTLAWVLGIELLRK